MVTWHTLLPVKTRIPQRLLGWGGAALTVTGIVLGAVLPQPGPSTQQAADSLRGKYACVNTDHRIYFFQYRPFGIDMVTIYCYRPEEVSRASMKFLGWGSGKRTRLEAPTK